MKLYIQEKLFTLKDRFSVKDESGKDHYFIEGELLSLGHKLHIKDTQENEVALIKEILLTLMPKFSILVNGVLIAEISERFTILKPQYVINGLNWKVSGNFLEHDYTIQKDNQIIATIHKKWMTWGDSFEIALSEGCDEIIALAVVLAIDCVLDSQERHHQH